jgi:hypothetical protein
LQRHMAHRIRHSAFGGGVSSRRIGQNKLHAAYFSKPALRAAASIPR